MKSNIKMMGVVSMVTVLAVPFVGTSAFANEVDPTPYNQKDALTVDSDKSAIVGKVNMLDGLTTYRLDGRGNETASEAFKGNESSKNSIHYDGEGLVETGKNKTDDNGVAWHGQFKDSEGNDTTIKELKWQQSDRSSITFAGANGTALKNVAKGVDGTDAVNVDQLNSVNQTAKSAQENANINSETIGALNTRVTKTEGDVTAVSKTANNAAIDAKNADANAAKASKEAKSAQSTADTGLATGVKALGVANVAKIRTDQLEKSKVDNTTFVADQLRQDKNTQANTDRLDGLDQTVIAHDGAISDTNGRVDNLYQVKADKNDVNEVRGALGDTNTRIDVTNANLDNESNTRAASVDNLQNQVNTKVSNDEFVADQKRQDDNVSRETAARKADTQQQAVINNKFEKRQDVTDAAIVNVNEASIARDKQTLNDANAYTDRTKQELSGRMDKIEDKAYSGIAASMAMTGLSPVIHANKSAVSVAAGSYSNQAAVAVGFSHRFDDDATTLRLNGAVANRHAGWAAGITHEF